MCWSLAIATTPHVFENVHMAFHSRSLDKLVKIASTPHLRGLVKVFAFHPEMLPLLRTNNPGPMLTDFKVMARLYTPLIEARLKRDFLEWALFKRHLIDDGLSSPYDPIKAITRHLERTYILRTPVVDEIWILSSLCVQGATYKHFV
jgi:hypothetical protein